MSVIKVKKVSHVALRTPDVAAQSDFYTRLVGLGETVTDAHGRVYLRCNAEHHAVVLIPGERRALDHFALDIGGQQQLESAAGALDREGIPFETITDDEAGQGPALRLRDPDGFVIEIVSGLDRADARYGPRAVQPRKLGHITLLSSDCKTSARFYTDVLGFRISDWFEDTFVWLRCNPDHHGVSFAHVGRVDLHHFAFEVLDFAELARQADHLMQNRRTLLYGPGRHGPGHNQFEYFRDLDGNTIEFTCDVQQIWDDDYEPRTWKEGELWINLWGPDPPPDFV